MPNIVKRYALKHGKICSEIKKILNFEHSKFLVVITFVVYCLQFVNALFFVLLTSELI